MLGDLMRRLVSLLWRDRLERELDEELRAHLIELTEALEAEGHSPDEARRLARLRLGSARQLQEAGSDAWRFVRIEGWVKDVGLAWRTLRRRPAFTAAAVATLALGIGASTAIFSVAWGVSVRPLPYPESDRLVRLYEANPANDQWRQGVSIPAFHQWRTDAAAIESAALFGNVATRHLRTDLSPFTTMSVSPTFFRVLGTPPAMGPGFKNESEYTRSTVRELVLSHGAWQRVFGGRQDVIGDEILWTTDDDPFVVVGVMPEHFRFTEPVDAWMPGTLVELPLGRILRDWRYDRVIARLAPGASVDRARQELNAVAARLADEFPRNHGGWTVSVEPLRDVVIGEFGRATWMLMLVVGVVLLVAYLNVGGLFVTRAIGRDRETALRVALGAGRWRLLRLWLVEALIVSVTGSAFGILLAVVGVAALRAAAPPGIPRVEDIGVDTPTLAVALGAGLAAAVLFSMAPLSRVGRASLTARLRSGSTGGGDAPARATARMVVLAAQCAGAAALVLLATVVTQGFLELMRQDAGWNPTGVLSLNLDPPRPEEMRRPWFWYGEWADRLVDRLEGTAGIERAAITTQVPLGPNPFVSALARGRSAGDDARNWPAVQHHVTVGYFNTLDIQLVEGRLFDRDDRFTEEQLVDPAEQDRGVAVVSASVARALWPGTSAIGEAVRLLNNDNSAWREVVGVVEDMQFYAVGEAPALHVFLPYRQTGTGARRLIVRASGDAASMVSLVRRTVEEVAPGTTVDSVTTQDALVALSTAQPRFTSRLVSLFAVLALGLAAVGIYGTLSFVVASRRREIGIRLALGASPGAAVGRVLAGGLGPVIVGVAAGLSLAIGLNGMLRFRLADIASVDAATTALCGGVVIVVALLAALGPAWRAAAVDPLTELRSD